MSQACVLIIDDEPDIRELLALTISRMGLDYHAAANLEEARNLLAAYTFDVCLTDMRLPDGNGVEFVKSLQQTHPQLPTAVITAHGNMEAAVEAMKNGAFDFVTKPVDIEQLRNMITGAIASGRKTEPGVADNTQAGKPAMVQTDDKPVTAEPEMQKKRAQAESASPTANTSKLIGTSNELQLVRSMIERVARSNAPVWITGESGTGKELIAQLIHSNSSRHKNAFIPINCGAIPSALMESELFGHKKGSFTGAVSDTEGLFRKADGGTLFLDEVAELPLSMQVKLLRAIQEKSVRPVGSSDEVTIDVRILSASHKDLADEVNRGVFRHDLYYRLNVISLRSPSLRDRPEDIVALARHIVKRLVAQTGRESITLSEGAMRSLVAYKFPGNVRELENTLERAVAMSDSSTLEASDLQLDPINSGSPKFTSVGIIPTASENQQLNRIHPAASVAANEKDYERHRIIEVLEENRWNRKAAAKQLGLTYRQLRYRISQLGIDKSA